MPMLDNGRRSLIEKRLGMSAEELAQKIRDIRVKVLQDRNSLSAAHPSWHREQDVRLDSLNTLWNLLASTEIGLSLLWELAYDDWWQSKAIDPQKLTSYDKASQTLGSERFLKHGFSMGLFILAERTLRIFLRAIDPAACNGATAEFKSVYSALLGSHGLDLPKQERGKALEFLDFMRTIRNLIHNDGIYFDTRGQDRELSFNGRTYRFAHAKPVNFVTSDLLLTFTQHIYELLVRIISHPKIEAMSQILDPFG